jgi:hypothetical protein
MNDLENLVGWLHQDTAELLGPSNHELRATAGDPFLKSMERDLPAGERQGFLEIWQRSYVGELVHHMFTEDLEATEAAARAELASELAPEKRALDLRFLVDKLGIERSARSYRDI